MIDALWCASHPFQCIGDALGPYWWAIGIFAGLILIGLLWRLGRAAYALGGYPALVGALGIIGTVIVAIVTALSGRDGREPTDIEGADAEPPVRRPVKPKPPRKPLFPNAPWNRR